MFLTFDIRIQGVEYLSAGHFTENDAFLYQWMADEIAEHGILPARDMHRWLPLGRDNAQHHHYLFYFRAWRTISFPCP